MTIGEQFDPRLEKCGFHLAKIIDADDTIGLKSIQKRVFNRMLGYAQPKGICFVSDERLAEDLGVAEKTIQRARMGLRDMGLLDWDRKGGNRRAANEYRFIGHAVYQAGAQPHSGADIRPEKLEVRADIRPDIATVRTDKIDTSNGQNEQFERTNAVRVVSLVSKNKKQRIEDSSVFQKSASFPSKLSKNGEIVRDLMKVDHIDRPPDDLIVKAVIRILRRPEAIRFFKAIVDERRERDGLSEIRSFGLFKSLASDAAAECQAWLHRRSDEDDLIAIRLRELGVGEDIITGCIDAVAPLRSGEIIRRIDEFVRLANVTTVDRADSLKLLRVLVTEFANREPGRRFIFRTGIDPFAEGAYSNWKKWELISDRREQIERLAHIFMAGANPDPIPGQVLDELMLRTEGRSILQIASKLSGVLYRGCTPGTLLEGSQWRRLIIRFCRVCEGSGSYTYALNGTEAESACECVETCWSMPAEPDYPFRPRLRDVDAAERPAPRPSGYRNLDAQEDPLNADEHTIAVRRRKRHKLPAPMGTDK